MFGQAGDQEMDNNNLGLVDQELRILELSTKGLLPSMIGLRLKINAGTVRWHRNNVCNKLEVKNVGEAIEKAREMGLLKS